MGKLLENFSDKIQENEGVYVIDFVENKKRIKCTCGGGKKVYIRQYIKSKDKTKRIRRERIIIKNDDKIRKPSLIKMIPYIDYSKISVYITKNIYYCPNCKKSYNELKKQTKEEVEKEILKYLFNKLGEDIVLEILNLKIPNEEQKNIINSVNNVCNFYIIKDKVKEIKLHSVINKRRKIIILNPDYTISEYIQEKGEIKKVITK